MTATAIISLITTCIGVLGPIITAMIMQKAGQHALNAVDGAASAKDSAALAKTILDNVHKVAESVTKATEVTEGKKNS